MTAGFAAWMLVVLSAECARWHHGRVHPGGQAHVFHVVDHLADVPQAHGRAVFVGDDDVRVFLGGKDLVVRADGVGLPRAVETALGRVDVVLSQRGADVLQADAASGNGRRIDADAHGRFLIAFDGHETDAGDFAEFLREHGVGKVVDFFQRQRVGGNSSVRIGVSAGLTLL